MKKKYKPDFMKKNKNMHIRLTDADVEMLVALAKKHNMSKSEVVRTLIHKNYDLM